MKSSEDWLAQLASGKMKSDTSLDYAVFQLSPKRSRCELIVSSKGQSEKLASGLVKPFVTHLKVAEEQFAQNLQSIKLEARKFNNGEKCLKKGTLERFVRFISTPEVLELLNTFDAEMSQLEAARKIYSQGTEDQYSSDSGGNKMGTAAAADATKKELLRAIDVQLTALRHELTTACARASAAGFNPDSVSELRLFADCFGAYRMNEACTKFLSLFQRRPELNLSWKPSVDDCGVRSSCESDMSLDDPNEDLNDPQLNPGAALSHQSRQLIGQTAKKSMDQSDSVAAQQSNLAVPAKDDDINQKDSDEKMGKVDSQPEPLTIQTSQPTRRLSVLDRVNLFESKKKENTNTGSGSKPVTVKRGELRRLSSDVSLSPAAVDRALLRRWSGASEMSFDPRAEKKDNNKESPLCTSSASLVSQFENSVFTGVCGDKSQNKTSVTAGSDKTEIKSVADKVSDIGINDGGELQPVISGLSSKEERSLRGSINRVDQMGSHMLEMPSGGRIEQVQSSEDTPHNKLTALFGTEERDRSITQASSEVWIRGFYQKDSKDRTAPEMEREVFSRSSEVTSKNETGSTTGNAVMKNEPVFQSCFKGFKGHSRSLSEQLEVDNIFNAADTQEKIVNGNQLFPRLQKKSHARAYEEAGNTDLLVLERLQISGEGSAFQKIQFQKSVSSVPEHVKRFQTKQDEMGSLYGNETFSISSRKATESQETSLISPTVVVEPVQRVRQSKGNQELNNDLKMKANELEKLFAEHKLRVPADPSSSSRNKPADYQKKQAGGSDTRNSATGEVLSSSQLPKKRVVGDLHGGPSGTSNFRTPPSLKILDYNLDSVSLRENFSELSDSRGRFYEKYMQKRDAKLREEWGSKRAEKEAELRYMHDSLEQSRAEMKARFSESAERQDLLIDAARHLERPISFNSRSSMNRD